MLNFRRISEIGMSSLSSPVFQPCTYDKARMVEMMPEMSEDEVCERLKTDKHTCDIPRIFISAIHEVFDKIKTFKIGGVDYIASI